MDKNKDFLIGKMSNEDELAIYGAILGAMQSINYNDKLIGDVTEAVDDENLNDKITSCIERNNELIISNTANMLKISHNVTEMSPGDISRIIYDVCEEHRKVDRLIENTPNEDVKIVLDKYKEVYTQLAAYAILWER